MNDHENHDVLVELLILRGNSREYRKQYCSRKSVKRVRKNIALGAEIIGSWVSVIENRD